MTRRKQTAPTTAQALATLKAVVGAELSTPEIRQQALQVAYEMGVSDGRVAGAIATAAQIGASVQR